jgi:hypothetical protein
MWENIEMDFDAYWRQLVDRVYNQKEILVGNEELFYRWSCIFGETMVDGIESYFERRFDQFDADIAALQTAGFPEIAAEFQQARQVMFGDSPLDSEIVELTIQNLLDETEEALPISAEIDTIYRRLIPRLNALAEYRYEFGLRENLYSDPG